MLSCTTSSALFVALLASLSLVCPAGSASRPALLDSVVNNVQRTWLVSGNDAGLRPDSKKALPAEGVAAEASGASSQQVFRNPVQDSNSFLRRLTRKGAPGQGKGDRNPSSSAASSGSAASRASRDSRSGPRQYDVPQIECPPADDGMERFACPTPDALGRYRCIDDHSLCDGFIDCPDGGDEDRMSCMFYKTTKAHLDVLADALLRWARGRY